MAIGAECVVLRSGSIIMLWYLHRTTKPQNSGPWRVVSAFRHYVVMVKKSCAQ